ncbi:MAG: prepilin peptidase [Phycisphaeraceae bacterium]|nr:prepilin peptidase [Phycisphaeraceae bacterium]
MAESSPWIRFVLLAAVLTVAAITDCRRGLAPNWLTLPAIAGGWVLSAALGWFEGGAAGAQQMAMDSLVATLAGFVPMVAVYCLGGFGGGDVKLVAAYGAITGSSLCVLNMAVYSLTLAAIMAVFVMIRSGRVKQTFGRLTSALLSIVARSKPVIPEDGPRVPFALAVAIGGILAGVECLLGAAMPWS